MRKFSVLICLRLEAQSQTEAEAISEDLKQQLEESTDVEEVYAVDIVQMLTN